MRGNQEDPIVPSTVSRTVPYVDLALQHAPLKAEILAAVAAVLDSGQFILGPEVETFEQALAELCGSRYAVGVNSGTDALVLGLRALGVGPGHEVIVPPNSFVASATAVVLAGARPVFADVGEDYNLDPACVEAAITPDTRAIMPVHLTGRPAKMDALTAIARAHGLKLIEDSAQAVGAKFKGRPVGSFGEIGAFSLHPLKTLNACGDGGALTTSDPALAEELKILRNIGLKTRDDCVAWSGNSRLDSLQAAILGVKLRYLDEWTQRRRENAALYRELLAGVEGVDMPTDDPDVYQVYHTFVIQADRRDALKDYLQAQGVSSSIHYPIPIHLHRAARELGHRPGDFPVTERQAGRILSLPVYPELAREDLEYVAETIQAFYRSQGDR